MRLLCTVPGRDFVTGKRGLPMTSHGKAASCTGKSCCRDMRQKNMRTGRRFGNQSQEQRKNPMRSSHGKWRFIADRVFRRITACSYQGICTGQFCVGGACARILPSTIRGMATRTPISSLPPDPLRQTAHGAQRRKRIMQGMKMGNAFRLLIKRPGCRS